MCLTTALSLVCCRTNFRTSVVVRDSEEGGFSEMDIVTMDRPGLLTDIVKVLKDINVNVISAEVGQHYSHPCLPSQPHHLQQHPAHAFEPLCQATCPVGKQPLACRVALLQVAGSLTGQQGPRSANICVS